MRVRLPLDENRYLFCHQILSVYDSVEFDAQPHDEFQK